MSLPNMNWGLGGWPTPDSQGLNGGGSASGSGSGAKKRRVEQYQNQSYDNYQGYDQNQSYDFGYPQQYCEQQQFQLPSNTNGNSSHASSQFPPLSSSTSLPPLNGTSPSPLNGSAQQQLSPMTSSTQLFSPLNGSSAQNLQQPPAFTQQPIQQQQQQQQQQRQQWQYEAETFQPSLPQQSFQQPVAKAPPKPKAKPKSKLQQSLSTQTAYQPQSYQQHASTQQQKSYQQPAPQQSYPQPASSSQSFQQPLAQLLPQSLSNSQYSHSPQSSNQSPLLSSLQYSNSPRNAQQSTPAQPQPLKPSPQQRHLPSPQQQFASPQQQFAPPQQRVASPQQQFPSPQQQFVPSPKQQFVPSPQQQFPVSPQNQHLPTPQQLPPSTQQQQFQLQQLLSSQPPLESPHLPSPQPPSSYIPPPTVPQYQPYQFQPYLPPSQQQPETYQEPVAAYDYEQAPLQWEQTQQQHQPLEQSQSAPPPRLNPSQRQQETLSQQSTLQQQPYFDFNNFNGFGTMGQFGGEFQYDPQCQPPRLETPSSAPIQGQSVHTPAPSSLQTPPSLPPTQPFPTQSSSLPTPAHTSTPSSSSSKPKMPKEPKAPKAPKASRPSSTVPKQVKRKSSQLAQASPQARPPPPAPQPSPRPMTSPATPVTPAVAKAPVQTQVPTPNMTRPEPETIPTGALLFHTAVSAHQSATYHLQQVFVPQTVQDGDKGGMKRQTAQGKVLFTHDAGALNTALRLLVMALDLLRIGFYMPNLSDSERAAFGLEFATVAAKLLATEEPVKKLLSKEELVRVQIVIDHKRILNDVEDVMTKTLAAARSPHLKHYRQGVELLSARLAFVKDKANHGKRIIKQALATTPREDAAHRYNLSLLYMNHLLKVSSVELLQVVKQFEADALAQGHQDVVLLAHIIRIRAHFSLRRWDSLLATLDESGVLFGTNEIISSGEPATASFRLVLLMHYLNMRALYHGRAADDASAKKQLARLYPLMDQAMDKGMLSELRGLGGVVTIPLHMPNGPAQQILVQSTSINVLWALTYVTSVVARRDLLGPTTQCRTLNHTRAMRQFEHLAHPDDLWDTGFSSRHGVADAIELRHKVNKIRAEVMMEQALAVLCRSSFEEVTSLLTKTVEILYSNKLFLTHCHQLALLYGHFMHAIGMNQQAQRYYKAAQGLLVPGSEMRLIVDINLMAAQWGFENLQSDLQRTATVNIMADQCRAGTNGALKAVGFFLSSLTDPERVSSKRKLTFAYECCRSGKLHVLYALIFAFTTAQHMFGDRERQLKQLESGREIAHLLGGKDRADGVGQLPLGMWYNNKLRDHYRLDGRFDDEKAAAAEADRHRQRLNQVTEYGKVHFPLRADPSM